MTEPAPDSLLIYAPVPLYRAQGRLYVEKQALNGLRLWARNFAQVTVMMPLSEGPPPQGWVAVDTITAELDRVRLEPLPMAYRPDRFLRYYRSTRRRIRELIGQARYLSFAIGGLFGDWGAVSCFEADRQDRPFAVWTDRVESEVVRRGAGQGPWRRRLRARLEHRPMAWLERAVIRRAALGLFHGRETFDTYAPYSRNPQLVHDIHIDRADHISAEALAAKREAAGEGPLRLCYVGRADDMKGPLDWIEVLGRLRADGVDFTATWLGEGEQMSMMRTKIDALGLGDVVHTPGFAADRAEVLQAYRAAQIFLFCHKTPESPRCLIEALISGTVLVGYDGAFARDLTEPHGSGQFVPVGDMSGLADTVARLASDRSELADLTGRAAQDGAPFDDVSVFEHRSEVIKQYL